jgi:hypothetical protein
MSQLVKTKRQANFKGFKRFGAFKGLVEQNHFMILSVSFEKTTTGRDHHNMFSKHKRTHFSEYISTFFNSAFNFLRVVPLIIYDSSEV